MKNLCFTTFCLAAALLFADTMRATILVEGITERGRYNDRASFMVRIESGFDYTCVLDGEQTPCNQWIQVDQPNYHELIIKRFNKLTSQSEMRMIPFVVIATERGITEFGLPPWTPYPVIPSAPAEFIDTRLICVAPKQYPLGARIPIITYLINGQDLSARLNGITQVTYPGTESSINIRRGYGFAFLPPTPSSGANTITVSLHHLSVQQHLEIETNTHWQSVGGVLKGMVEWPQNSRIHITSDLEIAVDARLHIGSSSLIKIEPLKNIKVNGILIVNGDLKDPVVIMPDTAERPWGGFLATNSGAAIQMTGVILTGGGGNPQYFSDHFGFYHRKEQPLFLLHNGARASLTNCFMIDNAGQLGNGYYSFLTLDRCLVQHCVTGGEYLGGAVEIYRSALLEFPSDTNVFADQDEDGIYMTEGKHVIQDSIIGWVRDDAIDAGSAGAGSVTVSNCWFEACFHEAMAWSGLGRVASAHQTVIVNCGQGVEAGYSMGSDSPRVTADRLLSIGNLVGARYGDNYDWGYDGFLRVTNSFLLYNQRDVWGMNFLDWTYRTNRMDIRGNFLTVPNSYHPENTVWNPLADGWRLLAYKPTPANAAGIGFASHQSQWPTTRIAEGVPVGLSTFSTQVVSVSYLVESQHREPLMGRLDFLPGEMYKVIIPEVPALPIQEAVRITLSRPVGGALTGLTNLYFVPSTALPVLYWFNAIPALTWVWSDNSAILEQSNTAKGPWTAIADAHSPYTLNAKDGSKYFRLRR